MAKVAIQISSLQTPWIVTDTVFATYSTFRVYDGQTSYFIEVPFTFDVTDSAQQINNKLVAAVRSVTAAETPFVLAASDPVVFSGLSVS